MDKKGVSTNVLLGGILAVLAILSVAFVFTMFGSVPGSPASIAGGGVASLGTTTPVGASVVCPSTGITNGKGRAQNVLAARNQYVGGLTGYWQGINTARVSGGALTNDGTFGSSASLTCGKQYQYTIVTNADNSTSAVDAVITASDQAVERSLNVKQLSPLQVRVKSKPADAYLNETNSNQDGDNTAYQNMNGTRLDFADQSGKTDLTVAADGYVDLRIYLKTQASNAQFGEDGLPIYVLVDQNAAGTGGEWKEPVLVDVSSGNARLSNVFSELTDDERIKFTGYEYGYKLGGNIMDTEYILDFYDKSESGTNPSADLQLDFCARGRFNSNKQVDTILVGCVDDSSSRNYVAHSNAQAMRILVS